MPLCAAPGFGAPLAGARRPLLTSFWSSRTYAYSTNSLTGGPTDRHGADWRDIFFRMSKRSSQNYRIRWID